LDTEQIGSALQGEGSAILDGVLASMEEEKDPRCLLDALIVVHRASAVFCEALTTAHLRPNGSSSAGGSLIGENNDKERSRSIKDQLLPMRLFETVSCYFPITFSPPPDDPFGIKPESLMAALDACLCTYYGSSNKSNYNNSKIDSKVGGVAEPAAAGWDGQAVVRLAVSFLLEQLGGNELLEGRIQALRCLALIVRKNPLGHTVLGLLPVPSHGAGTRDEQEHDSHEGGSSTSSRSSSSGGTGPQQPPSPATTAAAAAAGAGAVNKRTAEEAQLFALVDEDDDDDADEEANRRADLYVQDSAPSMRSGGAGGARGAEAESRRTKKTVACFDAVPSITTKNLRHLASALFDIVVDTEDSSPALRAEGLGLVRELSASIAQRGLARGSLQDWKTFNEAILAKVAAELCENIAGLKAKAAIDIAYVMARTGGCLCCGGVLQVLVPLLLKFTGAAQSKIAPLVTAGALDSARGMKRASATLSAADSSSSSSGGTSASEASMPLAIEMLTQLIACANYSSHGDVVVGPSPAEAAPHSCSDGGCSEPHAHPHAPSAAAPSAAAAASISTSVVDFSQLGQLLPLRVHASEIFAALAAVVQPVRSVYSKDGALAMLLLSQTPSQAQSLMVNPFLAVKAAHTAAADSNKEDGAMTLSSANSSSADIAALPGAEALMSEGASSSSSSSSSSSDSILLDIEVSTAVIATLVSSIAAMKELLSRFAVIV
jgi:hypothetical protein